MRTSVPVPRRAAGAARDGIQSGYAGDAAGGGWAGRGDPSLGASLSVSLKGSANAADDSPPLVSQGVEFNPTPGATPDAARFPPQARLAYSGSGGLNPQQGTVAFGISVEAWDPEQPLHRTLLDLGLPNRWENSMAINLGPTYIGLVTHDAQGLEQGTGAAIDWAPGEAHRVAFSWGDDLMSVYLDGVLVDQRPYTGMVTIPSNAALWVGGSKSGAGNEYGTFSMSDLNVFPHILSDEEVAKLGVTNPDAK